MPRGRHHATSGSRDRRDPATRPVEARHPRRRTGDADVHVRRPRRTMARLVGVQLGALVSRSPTERPPLRRRSRRHRLRLWRAARGQRGAVRRKTGTVLDQATRESAAEGNPQAHRRSARGMARVGSTVSVEGEGRKSGRDEVDCSRRVFLVRAHSSQHVGVSRATPKYTRFRNRTSH